MAKVSNNIFVRGLSGSLGDQFIVRKGRGGSTVITNKPSFASDRTFNEAQLAHQDAFRMAIAYAKSAKAQPVYIAKAEGTAQTAFNAAVADYFGQPEVLEIDVQDWDGNAGRVLRVKAQDDTQVTGVHIAITNGNGTTFEQGQAVQADGLWWEYTTTSHVVSDPVMVIATAKDLPGNNGQLSWQN